MVRVRHKERTEGSAHHRRIKGAAVELQQELLHKDRHPRAEGDKALL